MQDLHYSTSWVILIDNRTECRPILSVTILMIKQIGLPLRGRPILLITRMITDRIGLHSVLLPLLIFILNIELDNDRRVVETSFRILTVSLYCKYSP